MAILKLPNTCDQMKTESMSTSEAFSENEACYTIKNLFAIMKRDKQKNMNKKKHTHAHTHLNKFC
jgi:hypothetical protein